MNVARTSSPLPAWLLAVSVAVMACAAYAPSLRNDLTYDDLAVIRDRPGLRDLLSPGAYFSRDYFRFSNEATYRPLVTASYALDFRLWGMNPFGYHLSNLLWHCAACLAFFFACRSLGASAIFAFLAAALYGVHPIQSEAVCGAGFREDLMCAAFHFAAFALWPAGRDSTVPGPARFRDTIRVAGAFVCFVLALLSKEMALSFPLLAFAKDWRAARLGGESVDGALSRIKARLVRYVVLWLIAAGALALFLLFTDPEAVVNKPAATPLIQRMAAFAYICLGYLRLLSLPYPLRCEYEIPMSEAWFWPACAGSLLALAALGALCWRIRRRFAFGWESFVASFLMLGPVSNIIPLYHPMAERYLTLPASAFCWTAPALILTIRPPRARYAAAVVLLAAYSALSWIRVAEWRTQESLWATEIRRGSQSYLAHFNLGLALDKRGATDQAIPHLTLATRLRPDLAEAHVGLGGALAKQGKLDKAARQFSEAVRLNPKAVNAHNNLGIALKRLGRIEEAIGHYREAIRIEPGHAPAHNNLGIALSEQGKTADAIGHFQEAVKLVPGYLEAQFNLACALESQERWDEALRHYGEAARLKPGLVEAHEAMGDILKRQGQTVEARARYQRAVEAAAARGETTMTAGIQRKLNLLK